MIKEDSIILPKVDFDSSLASLIIDLDHLRKRKLTGTSHPAIFFQLKNIFHMLESIGSARIEGNNTTIAEYIDTKSSIDKTQPQSILEIKNVENAMDFIDEVILDNPIDHNFIRTLHNKVVENLSSNDEGDATPGQYRTRFVKISKSLHTPPDPNSVHNMMTELIDFINHKNESKYDLLKTAIAHHRFTWIHPFHNGNGRTVRLLTYAMLVKQGFNVNSGRILNPTAIFCGNREEYYHYLAIADKALQNQGDDKNLLVWAEYVLKGLFYEIEKIDRLLDHKYLIDEILYPAIDNAMENEDITNIEAKVLKKAAEKQEIKSLDIKEIILANPSNISRIIEKLKDKNMLISLSDLNGTGSPLGKRKYTLRFENNKLMKSIIKALGDKGFLPINDKNT